MLYLFSAGAAGGDWEYVGRPLVPSIPTIGELQIGNVKLQVTTGDITQATTDGIVNSSNSRLDLTMGKFLRVMSISYDFQDLVFVVAD